MKLAGVRGARGRLTLRVNRTQIRRHRACRLNWRRAGPVEVCCMTGPDRVVIAATLIGSALSAPTDSTLAPAYPSLGAAV